MAMREEEEQMMSAFPEIDPRVKAVGLSYLRKLKATVLAGTDYLYLIQEHDKPVAVVLPYDTYMKILAVMRTKD